jgi:hypothetical protein
MATIAQGVQAGQLAAGLTALQNFVTGLQAAVAAGNQVAIVSVSLANQTALKFTPPSPLTAADSAALMNELVSLAGGLESEWTTQLTAL